MTQKILSQPEPDNPPAEEGDLYKSFMRTFKKASAKDKTSVFFDIES